MIPDAALRDQIADIHEQARRFTRQQEIALVLDSAPVATSLTTTATFELSTPADLPDRKLRITAVEVRAERTLGTEPADPESRPGEPPATGVRGWAQPLKDDGTPDQRRQPSWVHLPDDLAPVLLGKAMTS